MQGPSRPDRELLDAAALCRHLVPESVPADVVAVTMVLQTLEGLSDRDAVRQLATNIAWKAAAGLALTDETQADAGRPGGRP